MWLVLAAASGNGGTDVNPQPRKKIAVSPLSCLRELPLDVWRLIWANLSTNQLAQASGVSREWRKECTSARRDEAVALVTAAETIPDSELTRPQQAMRGIQRVLNRRNPFSGEPFSLLQTWEAGGAVAGDFAESENGSDMFNMIIRKRFDPDADPSTATLEVGVAHSVCKASEDGAEPKFYQVDFSVSWGHHFPYPHSASIYVIPENLDDCLWMQGLLLAVTGGFQGLLRDGKPSSMPGSLALC